MEPVQGDEPEGLLPWRFYRGVRARRVLLLVACYAIAGSAIAVATAKSLSPGDVAAIVAVGGVCFGYVLYGAFRLGVKESVEGLSWFLYVTRTRIAWEQIRKIEVIRIGVSRGVIVRCDGRRNGIAPLAQGGRVVWQGGSTNDIVSVLTDRVNQVRRSRGLAPIE
jgi:hypothetical protein